jgi:hypothetical protein
MRKVALFTAVMLAVFMAGAVPAAARAQRSGLAGGGS